MNVSFDKNAPSAVPVPTPAPVTIDVQATVTPVPETAPVAAPVPVPVAAPTPAPAPVTNSPSVATPAPAPVSNSSPVTNTAPAPVPVSVPATTSGGGSLAKGRGLCLGDKIPDYKDVMMPRLNIAQSIGDLGKQFAPGSIIFDQRVLLFNPPILDTAAGTVKTPGLPPVKIVVLGFRETRYVEKVIGGARGMIVDTEDQVRAAGGTLDYREWELKKADGMKRFEPMAEALVAISRPDHCNDDDTVFVFPVENQKYALAIWAIKGTQYTAACKKTLFMHRSVGCLSKGYPTFSYALSSRWQKYENGNGSWIPVLIPQKATTPEFIAWVSNVLNPEQANDAGAQ